jgi:hypothetical protein
MGDAMRTLAALVLAALMIGPAMGQNTRPALIDTGGRQETIDEISKAMARIQADFNSSAIQASADPGVIEIAVEAAIDQMLNLRNYLVGNPYVRLAGFSVGFPAGISAEFEFPDDSE